MKSSSRYENWGKILESDEAPIISPTPIKALLSSEVVNVYRLNIAELSADQRSRLIDCVLAAPRHG